MPLPTIYNTGTASVANGATTVTLVGAVSSAMHAGDFFADPAQPLVPAQRMATDPVAGVFELAVNWPGTSMTADPYEVRITPDSVRVQERTRELLEQMSVVEANGRGLFYLFATATADADPGAGLLRLNHATIASATAAYLDNLDANGAAVQTVLDTWDDSGATGGRGQLWVRSVAAPDVFHTFTVTGTVTDGTGYRKLALTYIGGAGTFAADDELMVDFVPAGPGGATGAAGTNGTNGTNGVDGKFSGTEVIKTAAYTALVGDSGKTIILNKATADTLSFDAAATLGSTWMVMVKNIGAGTWSLDPSGAETIDGSATGSLAQNESVVVSCNGAALRSFFRGSAAFTQFTAASSAGPAQLDLAEDTDNGTNKVSIKAPSAVTADRAFVLPDVDVTISTFGASLMDDAAASNARTTLGLGTSATQNTGTSGANVPLLNANNTASGTWDFSQTGSFAVPVTLTSTNTDDVQGPILKLLRSSASPAVNDVQGAVLFQGRDDAAGFPISATMYVNTLDVAAASYDAEYVFQVAVASSSTNAARFGNGMQVGSPTGGYKGFGTINASDVYNDNVALTCMACAKEFLATGAVDLEKWDAMVPDIVVQASKKMVPVIVDTDRDEVAYRRSNDGSIVAIKTGRKERVQLKDWTPIFDEHGNGIDAVAEDAFDVVEIPPRVVKRRHGTAHLFAAMLDEGFDPRDPSAYIAKLRADEALPGMPSRANWEHNSMGAGDLFMRLWLATEMLALVVMDIHGRLATLEGKKRK